MRHHDLHLCCCLATPNHTVINHTPRTLTAFKWHTQLASRPCCENALLAGGDLYEDLKQRGGRFEEARTAAGVLRPCISALIYLHSKVPIFVIVLMHACRCSSLNAAILPQSCLVIKGWSHSTSCLQTCSGHHMVGFIVMGYCWQLSMLLSAMISAQLVDIQPSHLMGMLVGARCSQASHTGHDSHLPQTCRASFIGTSSLRTFC